MSHSVFKDFDDESGLNNKSEIADKNLIVFINKDGDVTVNQSALQDLIINSNTENKATLSVIRLGSPTPSMKSDSKDGFEQKEEVERDCDTTDESDDSSSNEDVTKSKKNENKIPSVSLTIENFYNPEQTAVIAEEIMNIAGITNPKQLKANFEYLRYVIENDHCYTTIANNTDVQSINDTKSVSNKKDGKIKTGTKTIQPAASASTKRGRPTQNAKANQINNSEEEQTDGGARLKSSDDANSSIDNSNNEEEEEELESGSDYSDLSVSESDNDRDSDLDFSVNDYQYRRKGGRNNKRNAIKQTKKINKKRYSTVEQNHDGSDDGTVSNRKKTYKIPKKNAIAKNQSTNSTPPSTTIPTKSSTVNSNAKQTKKLNVSKEIQSVNVTKLPPNTNANKNQIILKQVNSPVSLKATSNTPITPTTPSTANTSSHTTPTEASIKPKLIPINKQKDKIKLIQSDALITDMSSLFSTPDIIKKVGNNDSLKVNKTSTSLSGVSTYGDSKSKNVQQHQQQQPQMPRLCAVRIAPVKLASEQDKQLDLIDSLVQEEFNKNKTASRMVESELLPPPINQTKLLNSIGSDIPSIVKMLETPTTSLTSDISSLNNITSTAVMSTNSPLIFSTSIISDAHLLADDLLESFANSDDCLTEDLMQHVAKLVEDKNLQEVIDQQVLGVTIDTLQTPITTTTIHDSKPNTIQLVDVTKQLNDKPNILNKQNVLPATNINKEPIKVRRSDGRIIILPPIEAPTTRGAKRRAENPLTPEQNQKQRPIANNDTDDNVTPQKTHSNVLLDKSGGITVTSSPKANEQSFSKERRASVNVKRTSIEAQRRASTVSNPSQSQPSAIDDYDDYDDEEDGSDGSYNSEDDPHRLWCICRRPHNNRFMICCDKCEDWFHGKCVSVTKQMGTEMEERGIEWVCPNCIKKQQPSIKDHFSRKTSVDNSNGKGKPIASTSQTSIETVQNCMVCKKPARTNSIFCSDDCIRKHAHTTKTGSSVNESSPNSHSTESKTSVSLGNEIVTSKSTPPKVLSTSLLKTKQNRIVVFDKKSGKILTGNEAPTFDKLRQWLHEHPSCEVVRPGSAQATAFRAKQMQLKSVAKGLEAERELFATNQPPAKVQTTIRLDSDKKIVYGSPSGTSIKSTPPVKKQLGNNPKGSSPNMSSLSKGPKLTATPAQHKTPSTTVQKKRIDDHKTPESTKKINGGESIRISVRKTMIEQLTIRTNEITDQNSPKLTMEEIHDFVTALEAEMFSMFSNDTNSKYRSKYRSLIFNIKDRKNQNLFQKISSKTIKPKQLVRMSAEELASQELAKWRENENKHQLEMIAKSELDLLSCAKSYVLKTHKGEEVIENTATDRLTLDPSIPVQDLVSVLNNSTVSSTSEATPDQNVSSPIIVKDNRYEKYLSVDSKSSSLGASSKKGSEQSKRDRDRHQSSSSKSSSSKHHKRKRSRERHSHSHEKDRDGKREKSRENDRDRNRDKDKKERSSSDNKKERKDHKSGGSSSKSKHHEVSDKQKKHDSDPTSKTLFQSKVPKKDDNYSLIDKILEAQSTIDRILRPEEFKKEETPTETNTIGKSVQLPLSKPPQTTRTTTMITTTANESDQEPTSTVTIPTPPERTSETPAVIDQTKSVLWSGSISMIDVTTFQISINSIYGDPSYIEFASELDVVGRISPETVWDYIEKIKLTKEIVLLRFSPQSDDDESAYKTFFTYLDTRKRLGVIKSGCKQIKDFYILPLATHKSLPSVLLPETGIVWDRNRSDLLLGIIVKNKPIIPSRRTIPPKVGRVSAAFTGLKATSSRPQAKQLLKGADAHYTPPSSPNMANLQNVTKPTIMKSYSLELDDGDEPYSPGDSDEDESHLAIPTTFIPSTPTTLAAQSPVPAVTTVAPDQEKIQRKMEELNRQIEVEKMEIALLNTVDIDEPYSPSNSVSPPIPTQPDVPTATPGNSEINTNLANISIPANLADILKSLNRSTSGETSQLASLSSITSNVVTNYTETEYIPTIPCSTFDINSDYITRPLKDEPSKIGQLTVEELLRLVPDDSLIELSQPPPIKKTKYDIDILPPGIDRDEYNPQ